MIPRFVRVSIYLHRQCLLPIDGRTAPPYRRSPTRDASICGQRFSSQQRTDVYVASSRREPNPYPSGRLGQITALSDMKQRNRVFPFGHYPVPGVKYSNSAKIHALSSGLGHLYVNIEIMVFLDFLSTSTLAPRNAVPTAEPRNPFASSPTSLVTADAGPRNGTENRS